MPALPEWVIPILREFPVLVAVFVAAAIVVQYLRRQQLEEIARLREDNAEARRAHTAEIERVRRDADSITAHLEAQIAHGREDRATDLARSVAEIERLQVEHDDHLSSKNAEIRRLLRLFDRLTERKAGEE
jgi:hypothetical protein